MLFAGQDAHNSLLGQAIAEAPSDASPLQMVELALRALAATQPPERHACNARWRAVVDVHTELQERAALKYSGYLDAMAEALEARSVSRPTATVAADLGTLAFKTAFARWTLEEPSRPLVDLVLATLGELHAASIALR